jgi:hypothetical protein
MSARYIVAPQGKRKHIGVGLAGRSTLPLCSQKSSDGWYSLAFLRPVLNRNVTRICSACVREADRISGLAAGIER